MNFITVVSIIFTVIITLYIMHHYIGRPIMRANARDAGTILQRAGIANWDDELLNGQLTSLQLRGSRLRIPKLSRIPAFHPFQRAIVRPEEPNAGMHMNDVLRFEDTTFVRYPQFVAAVNLDPVFAMWGPEAHTTIPAADRDYAQKINKIQNYVKEVGVIKSDTQNVHDTQLINDLRIFYETLPKHSEVDKEEIVDYIINSEMLNEQSKLNALRALDAFDKTHTITSLNTDLNVVLATVWKNGYRDETLNALADCIERDSVVCITGRCNRLLYEASLKNAKTPLMTQDAYKHQIINEVQNIINDKIDDALKSPNDKVRAVAESYTNPETVVDASVEEEFKNSLKLTIRKFIDGEYKSKLTPTFLNKMQEYCELAVV